MKKASKSKDKVLLVVVILICILVGVGVANRKQGTWSSYSVNSTSINGYSIFYETMQRLGMKVKTSSVPMEQIDQEACQVIVASDEFNIEEHLEWMEQGGVLVYIEDHEAESIEINVSQMGSGMQIDVQGAALLANGMLASRTDDAYELYKVLEMYVANREIIFNEYYMHSTYEPTWWDVMPAFVKFMVLQGGLCLILYFWYEGKRFGKAMDLVEEVERKENEYLLAVAKLYKKAGAWDLAVTSYYNELQRKLKLLTRQEGDFLVIWEKEKLPEQKLAKSISQYIKSMKQKGKQNHKEAKKVLSMMEYLMQVIEQRREEYWKL